MDDSAPAPPPEDQSVARLTARVAQLEQQVAALNALWATSDCPEPHLSQPSPSAPSHTSPEPPTPPSPFEPIQNSGPFSRQPNIFAATSSPKSLEDRLGSQLFNLIGIVALLFGSAWALKLAIENGWIGVTGRVLIGLAAGAGLILWSELFRRKGLKAFSYSLKAVGTGVLYLSLWAAFQLYHLLPAPAALGAMTLVTLWNAYMAYAQDAELLAAYALIGGLLTPLLLSTGGDHETFLFTYLAVIDAAVVTLLRTKPWQRLLIPTFVATVAYFIGYYARFFHTNYPRNIAWNPQSTETALFAILFAAFFALVTLRFWTHETPTPDEKTNIVTPVLLPLANAAFLSLALYSVFEDSGLHTALAWLMVALAATYLGLMRLQRANLSTAIHLAIAIVFLTVAIPLKASGHTLTTAWLIEGLVLFWASTRFQAENNASSKVLAILSAGGYALGFVSVLVEWPWLYGPIDSKFLLDGNIAVALLAAAVFAGAVWLERPRPDSCGNIAVIVGALSAIDLIALLFVLREEFGHFQSLNFMLHGKTAFFNVDFATALMGFALVAATTWAAWRIWKAQTSPTHSWYMRITAASDLILFNLMALSVFVNEISALFRNAEAYLQRSLAISGFLMAYGAALLAIGFWRRNAFVRWQALILILFTIAKVFLFDISGLFAGYRVASFLALGALLLTVSFAYQKDWLALKQPQNGDPQ